MRVLSGKEVCKILEEHGSSNVKQKGSHIIMQKLFAVFTITVPVLNYKEIKRVTLSSIVRQSGLPEEEFE